MTPEEQDEWIWPEPEPAPEELQESEEDMAALGASEFRAEGVDYTINDPNNANEFSASVAYSAGQYVYYQGILYRFTADHAAGAWNSAHVTQAKLGQDVSDLKSALNTETTNRTNADNALQSALNNRAFIDFPDKNGQIMDLFHIRNARLATDGTVIYGGNYAITGFIPVYNGDTIMYNIVAPSELPAVAFYSAPDYDSYVSTLRIGTGNIQNKFNRITADGYIVIVCHTGNLDIASVYFENRVGFLTEDTNKARRIAYIQREVLNTKTAFSKSGSLFADYNYSPGYGGGNYLNTDFVKVYTGDVIHYKLVAPNSSAAIAFYTDNNYESFSEILVAGTSDWTEGTVTIESDGYIIAVCHKGNLNNAELYIENTTLAQLGTQVGQITGQVGQLSSQVSAKVNKPISNGTRGQVLQTNGNGTTSWTDAGTPTDEQIEESVSNWLDAHPEATTTVQDGSITPSKIAPGKFIAGGSGNQIIDWAERGTDAHDSHVEGVNNRAYEWESHVEGAKCFCDGKIGHAEGNACINSGNDAHAEGNRTVTGRRYYTDAINTPYLSYGNEDAGDGLGTLNYVIIPDYYGDVTSFFPNKLTDNIETRYGSGAQKDSQGNIYASGFTPAVWNGDAVLTANDLTWALHPYCILRGDGESTIEYFKIAKAVYTSGSGTKVYYYGNTSSWGGKFRGIYSSYAPRLLDLGNGSHSEGYFTSACGYGGHAEGRFTRAWGSGTHSEGDFTYAKGNFSHAEGYHTEADGKASHADGAGAVALRDYQKAYAAQEATARQGKCQACEIIDDKTYQNAGWHIIPLVTDAENGKTYCIESVIMGKQTAGSAGTVGDEFIYKAVYCVSITSDGTPTFFGTPTVTLVGRTPGMDGDGTTTGVRVTVYTTTNNGQLYNGDIIARFDSAANMTWRVMAHTKWEEMSI